MKKLNALGTHVLLAPLNQQLVTDTGIHLGRPVETPIMVVLDVGPDCSPGKVEREVIDRVLSAARMSDDPALLAALALLDAVRDAGVGKLLQPGQKVLMRRDLSLEFDWDGSGIRVAAVKEENVVAIVDDAVDVQVDAKKGALWESSTTQSERASSAAPWHRSC